MSVPGAPDRIETLLAVMARLRDPDGGCPWDREQTFATIAPYTIEEAYEVADAIARNAVADLKDELGDLLLQVVFHARIAEEARQFAFADVVAAIVTKMVRRHPHVFGEDKAANQADHHATWEQLKAAERAARGDQRSALDGIAAALPALTRAVKLQKRAATIGFDWDNAALVLEKLQEEMLELSRELAASGPDPDRIEDEFGDLLFVYANLARHLQIDPEAALRRANAKFERRFRSMEKSLLEQGLAGNASLAAMEAVWQAVKAEERAEAEPKAVAAASAPSPGSHDS